MVNVNRLELVLAAIEQSEASGGRRLDMSMFRHDQEDEDDECGTSACLAGWTAFVANAEWAEWPTTVHVRATPGGVREPVSVFARRWLGLTYDEAEYIFYAFGVATLDELKAQIRTVLADPDVDHGEARV